MNTEVMRDHWALVVASALIIILLSLALLYSFRASARGQLRGLRRTLAAERLRSRKANAVVAKAQRRKERLLQRADKVKPRHLQEAHEALEDARALAKIADEGVLIAENHVRRVILEEFPLAQHEKLRRKYLPEAPRDKRPFTF
jgi:hypothetical protein